MKSLTLFTSALLVILLAVGPLYSFQEKANQQKDSSLTTSKEVYYCPMHPEIRSSKPGKCPKCGMNLEKVEANESPKQSDEEMAMTCAQMCEMMMKNPSMMKTMHDEMMKGTEDTPSDSSRTDMTKQSTMRSCCAKRR